MDIMFLSFRAHDRRAYQRIISKPPVSLYTVQLLTSEE